jgi:hypothetical protein
MIPWRMWRATEHPDPTVSELSLAIADQLSDHEHPLDATGAWVVGPDHQDMSIALLSDLALYVCPMEHIGTRRKPMSYSIRFDDSIALAMANDGALIIHGLCRPSELFGTTTLGLTPAPNGWRFACRLRKSWEAQTGHRATGRWQERSWTRREKRRWAKTWNSYRQGSQDTPSRES